VSIPTKALGDVAVHIRNGLSISNRNGAGGVPITRIETISDHHIDPNRVGFSGIELGERDEWLLEPGDILFSHINSVTHLGKCALYEGLPAHLIHGMNLLCIRPRRSIIEPRFLLRALRTPAFRVQLAKHIKPAVNQASISISALRTLHVPTPLLLEQQRIADILDKADSIRRKRKEAIALTEQFLRSTFLEIFGDPVTNPKGWPKEKLQELIGLKSGNFLAASQMDSTGPHFVYGGNGINGRHSSFMFDDPVITIGRVGVYCGIVHRTQPKSWVTDNALYVASFSTTLRMTYLEHALRMANLNQYASQAAQPLISGGRVYPVEILVPPDETQEHFERIIRKQEVVSKSCQGGTEVADVLFKSLVQRAFDGHLGR
jgi:type I restriction enzyme S subunit